MEKLARAGPTLLFSTGLLTIEVQPLIGYILCTPLPTSEYGLARGKLKGAINMKRLIPPIIHERMMNDD